MKAKFFANKMKEAKDFFHVFREKMTGKVFEKVRVKKILRRDKRETNRDVSAI